MSTKGPNTQCLYPQIRKDILDGDLILFRGRTWFSWLIRWVTHSPYSHSGVVAWWGTRLMVLEAVSHGVLASPLSVIVERYAGKAELWKANDDIAGRLDRAKVLDEAQLLIGRSYSKFKIVRNLRRRVFGPSRDEQGDPGVRPKSLVCSELVSRVWRVGGIDLKPSAPDHFTAPADIAASELVYKVCDLLPGSAVGPGPSSRLGAPTR